MSERDLHPAQNDADDPPSGGVTPFLRPLRVEPGKLLPAATLYVHLDSRMLGNTVSGAAWCEDVGALTRAQVVELLGHRRVRVVPVLDLADEQAVDGYEVPPRMAEALHLRTPACASPWGTNTSRAKDKDHVVPYLSPARGGPPGQTRPGNLAPLSRFAHRVKTHGRWRLRQPAPGVYEWRSPHGFRFRVDRAGTTSLGRDGP